MINKNKIVVTGGSGRFAQSLKKTKCKYKFIYPTKKTDRQIHLYTRFAPCFLKPRKNLENQAAYLMKYVASLSHLWQFFMSEAFTTIHSYLLLFVLNSRKCSIHRWDIISMIISYPL